MGLNRLEIALFMVYLVLLLISYYEVCATRACSLGIMGLVSVRLIFARGHVGNERVCRFAACCSPMKEP